MKLYDTGVYLVEQKRRINTQIDVRREIYYNKVHHRNNN